ncbi:MAG: hypothetical protein IPP89_19715 [Saprospiraceae bacterium]|nr:hypothetical protein [Candidatus Brachybacter algidus]
MLGHSGSGKTTLVENILFGAHEINRIGSVDGNRCTSE